MSVLQVDSKDKGQFVEQKLMLSSYFRCNLTYKTSKSDLSGTTKGDLIHSKDIINLVTSKAAAERALWFNKQIHSEWCYEPESGGGFVEHLSPT
jgi:hypothetical protein